MEDTDTFNEHIIPQINDIYAIILDNHNKPFVGTVTVIEGDILFITENNDKINIMKFKLNDRVLLLESKNSDDNDDIDYKIHDIEKIIPYDIKLLQNDESQISKELTEDIISGLDISFSDISTKDIIYTDIELRENLLSELIFIYDAYENVSLQKILYETTDILLLLKNKKETTYSLNLFKHKTLPKWLIPIVDNPTKLYMNRTDRLGSEHDTLDEIIEIQNKGGIMDSIHNVYNKRSYKGVINTILNYRPIDPSVSDTGFLNNSIISSYYRDCLQEDYCTGINGNYKYDKRKNREPLLVDGKILNNADMLNIVGILSLSDDYLSKGLDLINTNLSLNTVCILQQLIMNCITYNKIIKYPIINKELHNDSYDESNIGNLISYNLITRINNYDEFNELLKNNCIPSLKNIIEHTKSSDNLLNYQDIYHLTLKYGIDINRISKDDKEYINNIISSNVKKNGKKQVI